MNNELVHLTTEHADILGMTSDQFIRIAAELGTSPPEAIQIYRDVFRRGNTEVEWATPRCALVIRTNHENGTLKFVQQHFDDLETESVVLPITSRFGRIRKTLCVSSQIGCARGCEFCEMAQMGFLKNLTAADIVGQWFAARHSLESSIDNIVFMGMGEPMDNLDQVIQAIRVFADHNGPFIAPSRMTVSTVGRVDGIERLAQFVGEYGFHHLHLAVSLNAPNDTIRSSIMPINRRTPMDALMKAMLLWPTSTSQRLLIEYVLIPGVNDAREHAMELCNYLRPLPCKVNVIPYNPRRDSPWPAPSEVRVREFVQWVASHGQFVTRRVTLGRSVMAACGQLGNPSIRRKRPRQPQPAVTGTSHQ